MRQETGGPITAPCGLPNPLSVDIMDRYSNGPASHCARWRSGWRQSVGGRRGRGGAKVRAERPPAEPDLASSVHWYRLMVLTRRFEDEAERAFRRGKIGGYLHLYSGQEAGAARFLAAIRPP